MFKLIENPYGLTHMVSYIDNRLSSKIRKHTDLFYVFENNEFKEILYDSSIVPNMYKHGEEYIVFGKDFEKHKSAPEINNQTIEKYAPIEKIVNLLSSMNLDIMLTRVGARFYRSDIFKKSSIFSISDYNFVIFVYHLVYSKDLKNTFNEIPHIAATFVSLNNYITKHTRLGLTNLGSSVELLAMIYDNLMDVYPEEKSRINSCKQELILFKLSS